MTRSSILLLALFVAACGGRDPFDPIASSNIYFCDENRQIVVSLGDNAQTAALAFEGRNLTLDKIEDDTYSNDIYTLYIEDEEEIVVEREGIPAFTGCLQR